jgi:peptidoglycan hydrolase-like protein with peptidoglycan-binding domain
VTELQHNLIALGYDPQHEITVDGSYDWATQAAVRRWQAARGLPPAQQDGQIPLGRVVFLPQPVRVTAPATGTGGPAAPGTALLTASSTTPVVDVALPTGQEWLVRPGQQVTITLPGGTRTPGRVLRIGPGVTAGQGQQPGSGTSSGGQSSGSSTPPTVTVVVGIRHPSAAAGLGQAQVQVAIVTQRQPAALVAPISALLARPGGGFQVTVVSGRARRNITVQTGLFDETNGVVAVSGPGLAPGMKVQVPSP